jgi:hypothetical protein
MAITKRRICWPYPDAVCLQGGCLYCNDYPFKSVSVIQQHAEQSDELWKAFEWGQLNGWPNVETK